MKEIRLLDHETIDKIAAGEVVERPHSVVKELVENAIDAGADAITVEIRDGGTTFIRVTDNGSGIPRDQVKTAFCRHATSKIDSAEDLCHISSLGFRGEALSSIAAVSMVELVTKPHDQLIGIRYQLEGDREKEFSDIGAPDGTTIIVRELFFNTPARKKFLKSTATEGGYIADLMEHMALSRPNVAFSFIANGAVRFHTSGNGDLREVIYRIYGREMVKELLPFETAKEDITITGYLGTPSLVRSNRNFEFFFVNGRYIRSPLLAKGVEAGYKAYLMQHRFPCVLLYLSITPENVDVNVHPSKMEVRFHDQQGIYALLEDQVRRSLRNREMIPDVTLPDPSAQKKANPEAAPDTVRKVTPSDDRIDPGDQGSSIVNHFGQNGQLPQPFETRRLNQVLKDETAQYQTQAQQQQLQQLHLFDENLFSEQAVRDYRIIGQVFGTFWLVEYRDQLLFIDQHAAHEKVRYEALVRKLRAGTVDSQQLAPPMILQLSASEALTLEQYRDTFTRLGFELEDFGERAYAVRGVPCDLYGHGEKDFFQNILDELEESPPRGTPEVIDEKLASMACKGAVKGNSNMSVAEMQALLDELLKLEDPYHCPHGRPTIITMSRYELDKKFKRIV